MAKKGRTTNHSSMEKEDSHEFNNNEEYLYNYYYFSPEVYTDENNCLIPSKASGAYSELRVLLKIIKSQNMQESIKENINLLKD